MTWDIVYKSAYNKDGSLFFPERLTKNLLEEKRKAMGSYLFANQYENKVIPDDQKSFKLNWLRYITVIPGGCNSFAFIDPAIGQKDHNDYTGIAVVDVSSDGVWYLKHAVRERLTPTAIVDRMFDLCRVFNLKGLGVEVVAYQEALLYILDEKMRQKQTVLPVKGVTRKAISKKTRILGLVPRFEWGKLYVRAGMTDFEDEYNLFPRAGHDDILDAVASLEEMVFYPEKEANDDKELPANHPDYERQYIRKLARGARENFEV